MIHFYRNLRQHLSEMHVRWGKKIVLKSATTIPLRVDREI